MAIGLAVVAVGTTVAFTVPVSHSFSVSLRCPALYSPVSQDINFPVHSTVSGSWSSSNDTNVAFEIRTSDLQTIVYLPRLQGVSGAFSFTANESTYVFIGGSLSATTVLVTGTYSIPLL